MCPLIVAVWRVLKIVLDKIEKVCYTTCIMPGATVMILRSSRVIREIIESKASRYLAPTLARGTL